MGNRTGQLQNGLREGAGVFRVDIHGTTFQRFKTDQRAAKGKPPLDGKPAILQELSHDLGENLTLDILLATDDDRASKSLSGPGEKKGQKEDGRFEHVRPSDIHLGAKKCPHKIVHGCVDDFLTGTVLSDASAVKHQQSLSQLEWPAGRASPEPSSARGGLQTQKLLVNFLLRHGIEGSERLVEQEDGRVQHHGAAQADALLLSSGEFMRIAHRVVPRESNQTHQLLSPSMNAVRFPSNQASQERDVSFDGQVRKQASALDRIADLSAKLGQKIIVNRPAEDVNRPLAGPHQSVDELQESGLATAAGSDDGRRDAVGKFDLNVAQGRFPCRRICSRLGE